MKSQYKQLFSVFLVVAILFAIKIVNPPSSAANGEDDGTLFPLRSQTSAQKRASEKEALQSSQDAAEAESDASGMPQTSVSEDGSYTSKEEVALYLHTYNRLPQNFIKKYDADQLGWDSKEGNLDEVAPGKSIGGSHYGNYEKTLPDKDGRQWRECDINYSGGYRGAERIIYSNDGLIYYTGDHYKTFEKLC